MRSPEPYFVTLKKEAARSSETSGQTSTTLYNNPENHHFK